MEPVKFTAVPRRVENYEGKWYWTDAVSTCELDTLRLIPNVVGLYGTGSTSESRLILESTLFSELLDVGAMPRQYTRRTSTRIGRGFWTISERTARSGDEYIELLAFKSLCLEVRVDTSQGPVHVGTADVMNILDYVCEYLFTDTFSMHFLYLPFRGDLFFKDLFDIDGIIRYDPKIPALEGPPPRPNLWQTRYSDRRIAWRLSRNSDPYSVLHCLEHDAKLHPSWVKTSSPISDAGSSVRDLGGLEGGNGERYGRDEPERTSGEPSDYRGIRHEYETPPRVERDVRYDIDFICNPTQDLEHERRQERPSPHTSPEAAAGGYGRYPARYGTPPRHALAPRYQGDHGVPTNDHPGTCAGEIDEASDRGMFGAISRHHAGIAAGYPVLSNRASHDASSHRHGDIDEVSTSSSEEAYAYDIHTSNDHVYDIVRSAAASPFSFERQSDRHLTGSPEPENSWRDSYDKSRNRGIRANNIGLGAAGQQHATPDDDDVSELSQGYTDLPDTDAVSAPSNDDSRGAIRGYTSRPRPSQQVVYDDPTYDRRDPVSRTRAAGSASPPLRYHYGDDYLEARDRYVPPRRPLPGPSYRPRSPLHARQRHEIPRRPVGFASGNRGAMGASAAEPPRNQHDDYLRPGRACAGYPRETPRTGRPAGGPPPGPSPREYRRSLAEADWGGDRGYAPSYARPEQYRTCPVRSRIPPPLPPRRAETWRPLFDRGKRATTRLLGDLLGRS